MRKYGRRAGVGSRLQNRQKILVRFVGPVQVATPDRAFDPLINNWLLYQTVSSPFRRPQRLLPAGGAYGYRISSRTSWPYSMPGPGFARRQILLHAAHQYLEGERPTLLA